jgi:hypothetical protein
VSSGECFFCWKKVFEGSKKVLTKWKEALKKQPKEIDRDKEYVIYLETIFDYELIGLRPWFLCQRDLLDSLLTFSSF